jgi:hypothetical protein
MQFPGFRHFILVSRIKRLITPSRRIMIAKNKEIALSVGYFYEGRDVL